MTAGTHLAGAALTASVLRGLGLELGPKWRDSRAVRAWLDGFNRVTQERVLGTFRVVEAVGRRGILIRAGADPRGQPRRPGGRLPRPRLPRRVCITGELELAAPAPPLVAPPGTYPHLHALPESPRVHPVVLRRLPGLEALLVRPGDRVERGEPIARYRAERARDKEALEAARARLERDRALVQAGALPRLRLAEDAARVRELEARLERLALDHASEMARLAARAQDARAAAAPLRRAREEAARAQLVRAPVSGRVAEVQLQEVRPEGSQWRWCWRSRKRCRLVRK